MEKQKQLQDSVSSQLSMFTEKTDDGVYKVQGAAVSIDNSTGKVAAIVGGREEDQEGYGLNRAYQSFRQPGSAIKPLLVYTPALEKGYTPNSTLDDSRMTGNDAVSNAGYSYSGSISLRRAVEKSSNVATYRLYEELGTRTCMKYLEALNFKGLDKKDYKYNTTCLGGFTNGTTVVEMAAGYATIANDGEYRTPDCIIKITDAKGNDIVPEDTSTKSVYSSSASRMMTSVLQSCVTEYEGTAHVCQLDVDMPAACKTGTTNNYVDGWLCGYTPYYTTAVWVGMDVYKSVDNLKGNTYPASIWTNYMNKIHQGLPRKEFESYLGDTKAQQKRLRNLLKTTPKAQQKQLQKLSKMMIQHLTQQKPMIPATTPTIIMIKTIIITMIAIMIITIIITIIMEITIMETTTAMITAIAETVVLIAETIAIVEKIAMEKRANRQKI